MNGYKIRNPGVNYTKLENYDPNNPCKQTGEFCLNFYNTQIQEREISQNISNKNFTNVRIPPFMNGVGTVENYDNRGDINYYGTNRNYQVDNPCNQKDTFCSNFLSSQQENVIINNKMEQRPAFMNCNYRSGENCASANPTRKQSGFGIY